MCSNTTSQLVTSRPKALEMESIIERVCTPDIGNHYYLFYFVSEMNQNVVSRLSSCAVLVVATLPTEMATKNYTS